MTTIAYKAFNADFTCRGFQYEVGRTYTHDGKISMCEAGFHACENPLDVLNYYNLCDSRFAVVELSGEILKHHEGDSKLCAATLHVRAELSLSDFVKTAVECLIEACKPKDGESSERVIGSSGDGAKLASSGKNGVLCSSGCDARAKGKAGTWVALAEFDDDGECVGFATGCAGKDFPADTWVRAQSGKVVTVENN
ncbi:MAG: hypothetical protein KGI82_01005 [Betaproteobacteria bacterium]|nr:hypothetical protein [Betaproteobacteria bacterium]